ncbi:hypothetical protein [Clostridium saccharoperbutylacetonicum]|uniref:hypothetical protein n=1 Tax=Clostridium saccharoperbutylacetonicum TaxID=36745 RepID=UPI000985BAC3|nr:hypothetical protein [Clostridium saccharoperbutylacetonicum]NSB31045.1 hypothetical protein [Clostridium saccharoperbutylacetonicum]
MLLFLYIIIAVLFFYANILKKENHFGCCFIYRTILKELKEEINFHDKDVINEAAITSNKSTIIKIEKDINDIRKFMGMKC